MNLVVTINELCVIFHNIPYLFLSCQSDSILISMLIRFAFNRDRRKAEVMGSYTESHQDDITQVGPGSGASKY